MDPPGRPAKRKTRPAPSSSTADAIALLAREARIVLGRPLTQIEVGKFTKYLELIVKWQQVHRLVGSADPRWITENLFVDSLLFLRALPHPVGDLLDLGAGAGFPGVPMKVVRPEIRLTLLEAKQRRVSFLSTVVRELPLDGVKVLNARAEDVADEPELRFDAVVMRCAGALQAIFPVAARFLKPGGILVASGPPRETRLPFGSWLELPSPNGTRRFGIHVHPQASV